MLIIIASQINRDLSAYHAPGPELVHCAIGLESCGENEDQYTACHLLRNLLGGGGSYSVGGPGRGLQSRLFNNVLRK